MAVRRRDNAAVTTDAAVEFMSEGSADAYVRVTSIDALHAEFQARGAKILCPPRATFYDRKEIEVEDCNGYVLCFGQDLLG